SRSVSRVRGPGHPSVYGGADEPEEVPGEAPEAGPRAAVAAPPEAAPEPREDHGRGGAERARARAEGRGGGGAAARPAAAAGHPVRQEVLRGAVPEPAPPARGDEPGGPRLCGVADDRRRDDATRRAEDRAARRALAAGRRPRRGRLPP